MPLGEENFPWGENPVYAVRNTFVELVEHGSSDLSCEGLRRSNSDSMLCSRFPSTFEPGSMALGSKSHENGREGSHLHQFDENKPQSMRRTSFSIDSEPFQEESGKASDLQQYSVDESMAVYRTVWNAVSADKRDLREVLSTDFADVDMRQYVPRDPVSSELTSLGSVLHLVGDCKRCVYVDNSTCRKGEMCLFCHFRHEGPVANGPSKKQRLRLRAKKGIARTGDVSGLPQEALTFGETGLSVI